MPAPSERGHAIRAGRIGASEVGAIVEPETHPYTTPIDVYARIVEGVPKYQSGTTRMRLGNDLEPYVASRWRERTGKRTLRSFRTYPHPTGYALAATPDYYVVGEPALLEIKVDRGGYSDDWVDLPRHVFWQVLAQLSCTGRSIGYVGALVGSELRTFVVDRADHAADESRMLFAVEEFTLQHLAVGIPPEPVPDELVLVVAPTPTDVADSAGIVDEAGETLAGVMRDERVLAELRDGLRSTLARYMAQHGIRLLRGSSWRAETRQSPNGRTALYFTDLRRNDR